MRELHEINTRWLAALRRESVRQLELCICLPVGSQEHEDSTILRALISLEITRLEGYLAADERAAA